MEVLFSNVANQVVAQLEYSTLVPTKQTLERNPPFDKILLALHQILKKIDKNQSKISSLLKTNQNDSTFIPGTSIPLDEAHFQISPVKSSPLTSASISTFQIPLTSHSISVTSKESSIVADDPNTYV